MNNCSNLYILSTIACQISECLPDDELEILAASLKALGEMLEVVSAQQAVCKESRQ